MWQKVYLGCIYEIVRVVGAHLPVTEFWGLRRDGRSMFIRLLVGMVAVGGRPQPTEVSEGTGRAQLCVYIQLWSLNSSTDKALLDRRVEDRAKATSSV